MKYILYIFLIFIITNCTSIQEPINEVNIDLMSSIDSIMNANFPVNEPGAVIIITKEGKEIYKKGFGMAHLELDVQMTSEMIFRLGSITKQFTAVSILLLEEQGRLSVKDDIRKHLPDYPTHGSVITIENLLTHTSGIPSFTKFPNRFEIEQMILTTDEILALFKEKPLDFQPGEQYSYNNSGYNILGAIIESVSGMSYENFVEKNIFEKLDMKHSFYDHPEEVVKNKIPGYDRDSLGYKSAAYMTMCAAFSAGGLRSNVEDLATWNKAIHSGKLITKEKLAKAFVPFKLNSGELSDYGFGWFLKSFMGHTAYFHGGGAGFFGFRNSGLYLPERDIYVAILSNNPSSNSHNINFIISSHLLGKAIKQNVNIAINDLDEYTGTYQIEGVRIEITNNGNSLSFNAPWDQGQLLAINLDEFYIKGEVASYTFNRDSTGIVESITVKHRFFGDEWTTAKRLIE